MEFSIGEVANKIIIVIICISALMAAGGAVFFGVNTTFPLGDAVPFGVGVALTMCANIVKVLLLKRAIVKLAGMQDVGKAKIYFQVQYFLRMMLTAAALLLAALLPDSMVSLWGAAIGIFAHPLAMYVIRFFVPANEVMSLETPAPSETNGKDGE